MHRWLDGRALSPDGERSCTFDHLDHAQVHVRTESAVQLHLDVAVRQAAFASGKVYEAQVDRLLEFVRVATRQDDPRDMRIAEDDVIGRMIEGRRPQEAGHIGWQSINGVGRRRSRRHGSRLGARSRTSAQGACHGRVPPRERHDHPGAPAR